MNKRHDELRELGWSDWFEQRAECASTDAIARVAAVDRELLLLVDPAGSFRARLAGRYRHRHPLSHERPCVGDWVCLEKRPNDDFGVVHALLERRTFLRRKASGKGADHQMIAANVDYVAIVQSCHFDFNRKRLERYLVMAMEGGAEPILLLTKTDLVDPAVRAAQVADIRAAGIAAPIVMLSNVTGEGVEELGRLLAPGKTYCLVGSSGVGKSTLINRWIGHERLDTKAVSGTGEGRHTTVRRELIRLAGGALVIDNPGMREFGVADADTGIESGFADISALSTGCRYRDCSHSGEPGCAVREAVQSGALRQAHVENYLKLRKESAFYRMPDADKRKKDRDFGRFIKAAKKELKRD